jgi:hypothetical protein
VNLGRPASLHDSLSASQESEPLVTCWVRGTAWKGGCQRLFATSTYRGIYIFPPSSPN